MTEPVDIDPKDLRALIEEKYGGNPDAPGVAEDIAHLAQGEPLAYVIGTMPFLGLSLSLTSRPLIPRVETEYWTELLIKHLKETCGASAVTLLDLCAGSGAIGLAVLRHVPNARVTFAELVPGHLDTIRENARRNGISEERYSLVLGDLFEGISERFDVMATNPPYIPEERTLEQSVTEYEPAIALFSGADGLSLIKSIAAQAHAHVAPGGSLWLEADVENVEQAALLLREGGATSASVYPDQYGCPRYVVAYYS